MKKNKLVKILTATLITSVIFTGCAGGATEKIEQPNEETPVIAEAEIQEDLLGPLDPETIRYTNMPTNIYAEPSQGSPVIGDLVKFSQVEWQEEIAEENNNYTKIRYVILGQFTEGWVQTEALDTKIGQDFHDIYSLLDYSPKYKTKGYKDNPRIEAKAVYMSANSAGARLDEFLKLVKETEINALVIDVKNDHGMYLFEIEGTEKYIENGNKRVGIRDIDAFMQTMKENNIYTIARIVTFKDPTYVSQHLERAITVNSSGLAHSDRDGLEWGSPHDRQLWEYDVHVAKAAAKVGFNEIQFDYVRFPALTKAQKDNRDFKNELNEEQGETIQAFLRYATKELAKEEVYVSADIYGQVGSTPNGMGIGQYWEAISNEVDYVSPMMYPSHYGKGVYGLSVPDQFPYETIYYGNVDNIERNENIATPAHIRPWIQDFTATWVEGYIVYGEKEVREQIQALEDLGINEYMLWNSGNHYTKEALK